MSMIDELIDDGLIGTALRLRKRAEHFRRWREWQQYEDDTEEPADVAELLRLSPSLPIRRNWLAR